MLQAERRVPAAPRVSVVIPTFDRPGSLLELFSALAAQTYRDFEVIVVNDAGPSIASLVERYSELAIRVIVLQENRRQAHASNTGIAAARGEFVMLCDDDDFITPCHLARLVARLDDASDPADLAYADTEVFGFETHGLARTVTSRRIWAHAFDRAILDRFSTIVPSGTLYRRAIHDAIGGIDPRLPCYWDWDFVLRLVDAGFKVAHVNVASVAYAFGSQNATSHHPSNQPYLDLLMEKHGLTGLHTSNFLLLLDEPELAPVRRPSLRVWDGQVPAARVSPRELAPR